MRDSHSPTMTSPTPMKLQESDAASLCDTSETDLAASPWEARSPSSEELKEFREKCAILEKERADKDQLIEALLKQLKSEREAHESLKRGVEGLGKELDSIDKLVYTMDDELTAVYGLLARSKVVQGH